MAASTTTRRWTFVGLLVLAFVLAGQLLTSHALGLYGTALSLQAWLEGAAWTQVPETLEATLAGPRLVVRDTIEREPTAASIAARLRERRTVQTWWVIEGDAVTASAGARSFCADAVLAENRTWHEDEHHAVMCGDQVKIIDRVPIGSGTSYVVFGANLDADLVYHFKFVTAAEVVLRVDGRPTLSSLRSATRDGPLDVEMIQGLPTPEDGYRVQYIDVPDYRGFQNVRTGLLSPLSSTREKWYVYSERLWASPRIDLVLMVPRRVMITGHVYGLILLAAGSALAMALTGWLLFHSLHRFREPLDALARSAMQVALGNFSQKVPVPVGHEMTDFCETYNTLLERLAELMRVRASVAREAGMAEIAAGVLHNVGNALTSVAAGVELFEEGLRDLPTPAVGKLAKLLEEEDNLAQFFASDPRGLAVPKFLTELHAALDQRVAELHTELGIVRRATHHAVEVLRAQQRYAQRIDAAECCSIGDAIDDALVICGALNQRRGIQVTRDYDDRIKTWIDRHRLIEIIVNLVNNAVDALGEVERSDRKVVIRVRERRGTIEIRVSDNGPGVAAQHRAKIFSYGYSTKPHGHGFGLHSSFNAATELGGWLRLETDSEAGATFSLILPRRNSNDALRRSPGQSHDREASAAEDSTSLAKNCRTRA